MSTAPLPRLGLEDPGGGIWDYVSPSRVNLWLKCPLAFRLRYLEGIRSPPSPSLFLGKVVHRGLEIFYRLRQQNTRPTFGQIAEQMVPSWDEMAAADGMRFLSSAAERVLRQQSLDLVQAYLHQLPCDEPRPLAVEIALQAPIIDPRSKVSLGIPLMGIIDLVLPGRHGPRITDFKTMSRGGPLAETTHELQLSAYSYLFRQSSPTPEEAVEIRGLVKCKVPRIERFQFGTRTESHFRRLFAVIRAYLDALDRRDFHFRPSHLCTACEFSKAQCPQWAP